MEEGGSSTGPEGWGKKGTSRSFDILRASRIHSSGSQEIPMRFFSNRLLNSHGEMGERRSSLYWSGCERMDRTRLESFLGCICHRNPHMPVE